MGHGLRLCLLPFEPPYPPGSRLAEDSCIEKWTDLVASNKDDGQRKGRGDVCLAGLWCFSSTCDTPIGLAVVMEKIVSTM